MLEGAEEGKEEGEDDGNMEGGAVIVVFGYCNK
jgi:hypothetical protein